MSEGKGAIGRGDSLLRFTFLMVLAVLAVVLAKWFKKVPVKESEPPPVEFIARVVFVPDGDSLVVLHERKRKKIRLKGVDAPEGDQEFGREARIFTRELVLDQEVTIREKEIDQYDRIVADVVLSDGRLLSRELVQAGFAWEYVKYSEDPMLRELEKTARNDRRGLWRQDDPIPPWRWRYQKSKQK